MTIAELIKEAAAEARLSPELEPDIRRANRIVDNIRAMGANAAEAMRWGGERVRGKRMWDSDDDDNDVDRD